MTKKNGKKLIPAIICGGSRGRAVVFGWVEKIPEVDEHVKIYRARMILRWCGKKGLFGVAANGPEEGTRITAPVAEVQDTARQTLTVNDVAARKLEEWPHA